MKIILTASSVEDLQHIHGGHQAGIPGRFRGRNCRNESKPYLINDDIMDRYKVGWTTAYDTVRPVKEYCGDSLGKGNILPNELFVWENGSLKAGKGNI